VCACGEVVRAGGGSAFNVPEPTKCRSGLNRTNVVRAFGAAVDWGPVFEGIVGAGGEEMAAPRTEKADDVGSVTAAASLKGAGAAPSAPVSRVTTATAAAANSATATDAVAATPAATTAAAAAHTADVAGRGAGDRLRDA
jgi:hypothetical protein